MTTAIVDYGSGNLRSVAKAFERAADEIGQTEAPVVTADPTLVAAADRIVLPGVGAFADCMAGLIAIDGMIEALEHAVAHRGRPFLGICVGMQLMARIGREHGDHAGLGWIGGEVIPLNPGPGLRVPHMGWQDLRIEATDHAVLAGIETGAHAYFVHSYHFVSDDGAARLASVDYGGPITAAVGDGNRIGTQFHPEKSQATGLKLIANFLRWHP